MCYSHATHKLLFCYFKDDEEDDDGKDASEEREFAEDSEFEDDSDWMVTVLWLLEHEMGGGLFYMGSTSVTVRGGGSEMLFYTFYASSLYVFFCYEM